MAYEYGDFKNQSERLRTALKQGRISREDYDRARSALADQMSSLGPDLGTFQTMLDKLTGSKMDQQGQIAAARRGDIYAGGLANMMSNF